MLKETENIELKISWRDEYLKTIAAFANTSGGKLFLGIRDDGKINGLVHPEKLLEDIPNKISNHLRILSNVLLLEMDNKPVIEIITHKSLTPVSYQGRFYVRSGSTTQEVTGGALQDFILKAGNVTWDEVTMPEVGWDDFDARTINQFTQQAIQNNSIPHDVDTSNHKELFEKLKLIRNNEFTRAAVLLFAKEPTSFFSVANCKVGRFGGNDPTNLIFDNLIEENLFSMPERIMEVLKTKYLPSRYEYSGLKRIQKMAIPEKALREAILNALIHRDYSGAASTLIRVYDNTLSIWNDGSLIPPLSLEMLRQEHPSLLRNRLIANIFYYAGYIEAWGRGTLFIIKQMTNIGMYEPVFSIKSGGFDVSFHYEPVNEPANEPVNEPVNERQKNIISSIKHNNLLSINELADLFGVSRETIKRDLKKLKKLKLILRVGSDKTGYWEIS